MKRVLPVPWCAFEVGFGVVTIWCTVLFIPVIPLTIGPVVRLELTT